MRTDQAWIITAALVTITGIIGWAWHRYMTVATLDGEQVVDEDCADGLHEYCLTSYCDCSCHQPEPPVDDWADELHVINLAVHRDRPIAQLTHYEIEAVIKDLGRADWLPERWQAAA